MTAEGESRREPKITLTLDNSPESRALRRALERRGVPFKMIYASRQVTEVPAWSTRYGTVRGWHAIKLYFLTPEECQLEPDKTPDDL